MLIRPYVDGDYAAVTALWDATGISIHYNDPAKDIPRMQATHNCQLYVGCVDERVIATIMVGHEGHRGWLYKLAVMPEFQGKGYGRALVEQAERWLVARGAPKVNLMIRDTNIKVREFYERLDYKVAARTVMERWLKPAEIELGPSELDVLTTYLEMTERPTRPTVPRPAGQYAVLRLEHCSVHFYRYLYDVVGKLWMWTDRRKLSDAALDAEINAEGVEIYVLYAGGEPAGYVELDRRQKPDIHIAYFGLAPSHIGRGLGRYLLNWAVDLAWSYGPQRLTVSTWSFDHPRAFANYQKAGFRPYKQTRGRILDPRLEGTIPAEVQPRLAHPMTAGSS
ncbi:MAG TPA: GNAT family acetyltransferase [Dongiaceae bacterium]|jgi:GNAT superfamily N-acetyltransferase